MGVDGKKQMWATLRDLAGLNVRLTDIDFDRLVTRATEQRDELEPTARRRAPTPSAQPRATGDRRTASPRRPAAVVPCTSG